MTQLELYTYFRSSAAFRVRIALNVKGLAATHHFVSLLKGEQAGAAYGAINPQHLVPALGVDGEILTQSLAIIEYLDEAFPETPQLVWGDAMTRAKIRALALSIACEIHPINNLRVLNHLRAELGQDDDGIKRWCRHWMRVGFEPVEAALEVGGPYCVGDRLSLADVVLVPQVFNAQRFKLDMAPFPKVMKRFEALMKLPAFIEAQPARQGDAI